MEESWHEKKRVKKLNKRNKSQTEHDEIMGYGTI